MPTSFRLIAVTDLHRSQALYAELSGVVSRLRPDVLAFVGDFLDCMGLAHPQLTSEECATVIARLTVPEVVFVRGNHEDLNWLDFEEAWNRTGRKGVKLHGEAAIFGPAVLVGFPCYLGNDDPFAGDQQERPYDPNAWLPKLLEKLGPPMRTLWLMHEPPAGTPLSNPDSPVAGNSDWNVAIERFSPSLTISGHDHLTPLKTGIWYHRLGSTVCVNVGQTDAGPLHYTLVEAEFPGETPSLPSRMRVTAFPMDETRRSGRRRQVKCLVQQIVSGGQTGADRAALDWAIQNGVPHGGWCPKGRKAEDGVIDARYHLRQTTSSAYSARTELNVRDSDGTVIISIAQELMVDRGRPLNLQRSVESRPCISPRPILRTEPP